ncbi:MAG: hypothetical protein ACUVRJ_00360 [Candidatus Villigracilaceae bacterium]
MTTGLDLHFTPLYRQDGQEMPSLPGLLLVTPPNRAAHGRAQDPLIVYLTLSGNTSFTTSDYLQATTQAAARFYQTPGSLTYAMRAAAQALNEMLLERNLRTTGRGQFAIGWLILGALREDQLTLLLSGPMHAFVFGQDGTRHIYDPALSGRGLGLGQALTVYFAQAELQIGQNALFCSQMAPGWETALLSERGLNSPETLQRRLLAQTTADLNAVLLHAEAGNGRLILLKGERNAPPAHKEQQPAAVPPPTRDRLPLSEVESTPGAAPSAYAIPPQPEQVLPAAGDLPLPPRSDQPAHSIAAQEGEKPSKTTLRLPRLSQEQTRRAARTALNLIDGWRHITDAVRRGFQKLLPLLLPGSDPRRELQLPNWWMAFIAVVIPFIVVTIASLVYFSRGSPIESQQYFEQAQVEAARAARETDPLRQREAWEHTLALLDLLEARRETPESQALRREARSHLDDLLGIIRLDYQPLISTNLGKGVYVTRLAANDTDLYLLDETSGQVLRFFLSGNSYQRDGGFECKKGIYDGAQINSLVDILILPRNNTANATLLGLDAVGNLIYCGPGQKPKVVALPPPDTNWTNITAATLDSGLLYVLDGGANAVWVYAEEDGVFKKRPYFYFDDQVPFLGNAVDLAVNGDDLYVLHADSHLTTCTYGRLDTVPTRCVDPRPLVDPHPAAAASQPSQMQRLKQILISAPPDSALLILDATMAVVYRFSPRQLELQNQFYPLANVLGQPAGMPTAMTMNASHILFMAFGDRIYFANNVP